MGFETWASAPVAKGHRQPAQPRASSTTLPHGSWPTARQNASTPWASVTPCGGIGAQSEPASPQPACGLAPVSFVTSPICMGTGLCRTLSELRPAWPHPGCPLQKPRGDPSAFVLSPKSPPGCSAPSLRGRLTIIIAFCRSRAGRRQDPVCRQDPVRRGPSHVTLTDAHAPRPCLEGCGRSRVWPLFMKKLLFSLESDGWSGDQRTGG